MTREEQDKNWANLSQEGKTEIRDKYAEFSAKNNPESKGYCQGLANVFGEHNLKPALTYEDVARELGTGDFKEFNNKLEAIGKLMAVAKFLNKNEDGSDWKPDFDDEFNEFYTLGIDPTDNSVNVIQVNIQRVSTEIVYFRTPKIAQQVIQILGEDVVRTALTTVY